MNSPKTHFGTNYISDRKTRKKRTGIANWGQNYTEKQTLSPRRQREIHSVEGNTSRYSEWKIEIYPKQVTKI